MHHPRSRVRVMLWSVGMLASLAIVFVAGIPGLILVAILVGLALRGRVRVEREVMRASTAAFLILGWSIGSRFDRAALDSLAARTPHIAIAVGAILATALVMAVALWRGFGYGPRSAFLATAPGGLPELSSTAALGGVELSSVMPVQVTRVVVLLVLLPTALALLT